MPLALKAMVACDASNPYGILKANTNWAFYHPHLLFIINNLSGLAVSKQLLLEKEHNATK
jgi:hypothetical protein